MCDDENNLFWLATLNNNRDAFAAYTGSFIISFDFSLLYFIVLEVCLSC